MRFQFWSMSEDSRVGILLRGSSVRLTLHIRAAISISHLSIPGIVDISHCFVLSERVFNCLSCSACINLTSFLFKSRFIYLFIIYLFIYLLRFFFFWLSNFSHIKRLRLVDYLVFFFCFLSWNCRVIVNNFITFLQFPKDLQFSSFISTLT